MSTFLVEYRYVPDIEVRREPARAAHRAYLDEAYQNGVLLFAGAARDPVDRGVLLIRADDPGAALTWASGDPIAKAGLLQGLDVRELSMAYPSELADGS